MLQRLRAGVPPWETEGASQAVVGSAFLMAERCYVRAKVDLWVLVGTWNLAAGWREAQVPIPSLWPLRHSICLVILGDCDSSQRKLIIKPKDDSFRFISDLHSSPCRGFFLREKQPQKPRPGGVGTAQHEEALSCHVSEQSRTTGATVEMFQLPEKAILGTECKSDLFHADKRARALLFGQSCPCPK